MSLPPLTKTGRLWLAGLAGYLVAVLLLALWLLPSAGRLLQADRALALLQQGWQRETLLAQMALEAQRNGRTEQRNHSPSGL